MELLYAEMTAVNCNGLGFITQYWPAINIILIVIKAVTVLFAALSGKDDKLTRILNVLIVCFVPVIGVLYYWGRVIYFASKYPDDNSSGRKLKWD